MRCLTQVFPAQSAAKTTGCSVCFAMVGGQKMRAVSTGILFNAKIHPKRKLQTLSDAEKQAMYESVTQTLSSMTASGGRDTEKDIFGVNGGYITKLSAKIKNDPCPVCGGAVIREAYMGGNIYYCPVCQKI